MITDQLAVGTQNCFSTVLHALYTNIKTSDQTAPLPDEKIKKKFLGRGHAPRPLLSLGRGIPSPQIQPLVAFGASTVVPSALGVPVPFHLRLKHCINVR